MLGPVKAKPCGGRKRGQPWPTLRAAAARSVAGTEEWPAPRPNKRMDAMPAIVIGAIIKSRLSISSVEWSLVRCCGKGRIGQHIGLGVVQKPANLGNFGRSWSATLRHCSLAASASSWANAVEMKVEMTRRPLLPACASALRMKCTRGR